MNLQTARAALWTLVGAAVLLGIFFFALGGVDPAEAEVMAILIVVLGVLWLITLVAGGFGGHREAADLKLVLPHRRHPRGDLRDRRVLAGRCASWARGGVTAATISGPARRLGADRPRGASLGLPEKALTPSRVVGIALLAAGVFLIVRE